MGHQLRLQPTQTLREVLAAEPRTRRIFEAWNVDCYCGGDRTLGEICGESGYLLEELQSGFDHLRADAADYNEELEWYTAPLKELTDHIVLNHHAYLRKKMPELLGLAIKVADIHGEEHPETMAALETFTGLKTALEPHLAKEEEIPFPSLCAMETAAHGKPDRPLDGQPLEKILPMVLTAHDRNNGVLKRIRKVTNDFTVPEDACYSFQRLWKGFKELERNMHRHLHLENNILFPRALDYEKRIAVNRPPAGV